MDKTQRILEEVEKTLQAFDDLPKLKDNPYLFTRVWTRLTREEAGRERSILRGLTLRPIAIAVVIILNIVTVIHVLDTDSGKSPREQLIYALSQDYDTTTSAF